MSYLHDDVFDTGLNALTNNVDKLHICSSEPASWADVGTGTLGNKATPTVGAPADRAGGGREVTVGAIADGSVTADGTAAYWALVDEGNTKLLAAGSLDSSQVVSNGNTFTLTSFKVGIPDPA